MFGQLLMVGIETDPNEPELTRIYVGTVSPFRTFILVDEKGAEQARRTWNSTLGHVYIDLPQGVEIYREELP